MSRPSLVVSILALALLAGCATPSYDRTEITGIVRPSGGDLSEDRLYLPLGSILTATITSYDEDDEIMNSEVLVEDPSIIEVYSVLDSPSVAFFGVKPGSTNVSILANGQVVRTYTGTVVLPPDGS